MTDKPKSRWLLNADQFGSRKEEKADRDQHWLGHFDVGEEALYNKGFVIHIQHIPTKREVEFSAFITDQSDAYTSTWTEETVFGRMDPIATFESTRRVASLGFTVPAYSERQAVNNLSRINSLLSFLYPTYAVQNGASNQGVGTTLNMGPLVRVKYANIIANADNPSKGLLGYITTGITVTPNLEAGVFASYGDETQNENNLSGPQIIYRAYDLNFELTVLHEHSLGFVLGNSHGNKPGFVFRSKKGHFPYAMGEKVHLPYTVHGMDFSKKQQAAATARAAARVEKQAAQSYGKPDSKRRNRAISLLRASQFNLAQVSHMLDPKALAATGKDLNTQSGLYYAVQDTLVGVSATKFSEVISGTGLNITLR